MDKKRLRRWLLLFFLALLLPAALLIQQSYSRLKWETFHQYQKMASELSRTVDKRLSRLIAAEDKRAFTDYSFLSSSDKKTNTFQRSSLSNYPIESDFPGVLGYFQVDAQGKLITPVVPPNGEDNYGVSADELNQRIAIQNQLQQILAANQLVREVLPKPIVDTIDAEDAANIVVSSQTIRRDSLSSMPSASSPNKSFAEKIQISVTEDFQETGAVKADSLVSQELPQLQRMPPEAEAQLGAVSGRTADQPRPFEQLKERSKQVASQNNYVRLEDVPLKQNYQQKREQKKGKQSVRQAREVESSRVVPLAKAQVTAEQILSPSTDKDLRIRTFESAIDPFEFSQLDSGHFVLFRKVWLNGQRYTQGLLIEQLQFLSLISDEFRSTSLSQMSSMLVAYQGNVLTRFTDDDRSSFSTKSQAMIGEELYQTRLSDPLSDLQMIYSVTDLPAGPGGRLVLWLALIMASILLGGFYFLYRLGLRQINLANQQQDFVSAVSHELKTPLTSIRMYGEILKQGWASEEKKRSYYDFIYDESERLSRLINNVLQLARMNRNEQAPELILCNVGELVKEIQSKITSQVESADFKLTIDADELTDDASISIDRDWLMQVMINLVDNAIKFSAKAERKEVVLSAKQVDKKSVQFTVSDFGPGIDKQHMKAIFELFYRSENELTRDTVGTGIGLSLVHQMVTSMSGKVTVNNSVSAKLSPEFPGAAFSVSFPLIFGRV